MELNNQNYHSKEARLEYMGSSQFKDFCKCPKEALAKINGEIEEEKSDALLFGSYVDAYFSDELDEFMSANAEYLYNKKNGELKAAFKNVYDVIGAIESDEKLLKYLKGEHQVIMTGEIAGVKFKIKIDSYFPDKVIVDQKIIRTLDKIWVERDGYNVFTDFIDAFGYDIQGAIYQSIVEQNTGKKLPFVLAVATKEDVPDKALIEIDQEYLDAALKKVEELAPKFDAMKKGLIEPYGCGRCSICRNEKKVTGIQSYKKLYHDDEIEY